MSGWNAKRTAHIFYLVGSALCFFLFMAFTVGTLRELPQRDHRENLTEEVALGKRLWDENDCVGCHTLLGEGAYYAPELGNVIPRRGEEFVVSWIHAMPTNIPGRRQMPHFDFTPKEMDAMVAFLRWTSRINTANWPPNIEG